MKASAIGVESSENIKRDFYSSESEIGLFTATPTNHVIPEKVNSCGNRGVTTSNFRTDSVKRQDWHLEQHVTTDCILEEDGSALCDGFDQKMVREQLAALLRNELFRKSQRCTEFLRYVVEAKLRGETGSLKEKIIGVNVFGRSSPFDTATDNIVRDAASQVRRRLAHYYAQPGHRSELRIELFKRSYVPQFGAGVCSKLVLPLADSPHWAISAFWGPLVDSVHPVRIGIGSSTPGGGPLPDGPLSRRYWLADHVLIQDVGCVLKFALFLQAMQQKTWIQKHTDIRFQDLCEAPAILVGAYNNQWTVKFTEQLRFRLRGNPTKGKTWIEDCDNPSDHSRAWDWNSSMTPTIEDYSIVARALDPETGQVTVAVAGQSWYGTAAAGEFLTNEVGLSELFGGIPEQDRRSKNLEAVLSTKVVGGMSFPSKLMEVHVW